jgi:hypothetical protein
LKIELDVNGNAKATKMQKISHAQNCFFQFPAFDVEIDIFLMLNMKHDFNLLNTRL